MDWWLENAARKHSGESLHTLVDCGYVRHKRARDNADKLLRHVGRRNVSIAGYGRLLVRIPPTKTGILRRFRLITAGEGYSWTTHVFERGGPQFDTSSARRHD